jgi:peptide/nickel transport system permease protein
MRDYILRRLLLLPVIMLGVSFLTFLAFHIIPGDVVDIMCGFSCSPADREAIRDQYGLNDPLLQQYWNWLKGIPQGDFGHSFNGNLPVSTELERRMPITIQLMMMTMAFSIFLGIPLGVLSAVRPGTLGDGVSRFASILWLSIPAFYSGTLVVIFGALWFGWTPPQFGTGYIPLWDDPLTNLEQFLVPSLILAFGSAGIIIRVTRSSMLEVMRNDYIRTAWSKGLRERVVVWRHALKNALIPVVTYLGLEAGGLLGGAVIIESIFALPGVGLYVIQSVISRELLVVQSLALLFAAVYVLINLGIDILYAWLDPRIRYA